MAAVIRFSTAHQERMQQAETRLVEAQRLLDKGQYTEASGCCSG